jgi:uncharacterized protein (TIGR03084 family)
MGTFDLVLADLVAESAELDALVAGLDDAGWATPTPAEGWTVAHQIAHLAWTDRAALLAATEPDGFALHLRDAVANPDGFVDAGAAEGAALPPGDLLAGWRSDRDRLAAALTAVPAGVKLPWYGPPMSPASMATARLMETWAHGGDVADALGVRRAPTARLRNVAHLAVRTRDFAYMLRDRTPPAEEFRVELTGPDGDLWTWGPDDADQRVTGSAYDFCRVAVQRLNRGDADLKAQGPEADAWLDIIQAFAGPPGPGRPPASGQQHGSAR